MRNLIAIAAACAAVALSGCTTSLTVERFDESDPLKAVGTPLPLMFTSYDVEIKRRILHCDQSGPDVRITVDVKSTRAMPDPKHLYVLKTDSLASVMKTGEVKTTYHPSGAVAALNAKAEDKSVAVLSNVVTIGAKVASIGLGAGKAPNTNGKKECTDKVMNALYAEKVLDPKVKASRVAVETLTERLADLTERIALAGGNPSRAMTAQLEKTVQALKIAIATADVETVALDKALKDLTHVQRRNWPTHGDQSLETIELPAYVFESWGVEDKNPNARAKFSVTLSLTKSGGAGRSSLSTNQKVDPKYGVPYRAPSPGLLRACSGTSCSENDEALSELRGQVLQMGHVYYLHCVSRPFSSVACSLEFAESGELKTAGSEQKAAVAEGFTGALKDAVSQVATYKESKASAEKDALEAKVAVLKLQVEKNKLEAELNSPSTQKEIDALKLENELDSLKKASIEGKLALKEAQAKVAP